MKTSLIIPFKNEKEYAAITMAKVWDYMHKHDLDFELVAVDDSDDGSWEILNEYKETQSNVKVVKGGDPPGYGKALRRGFEVASGDILIPFNGDLCDSLEDVRSYISIIEDGYDMAFGSRYMEGGVIKDHPSLKVARSRAGIYFMRTIFATSCSDITNTFKAYRREVIDAVDPEADGYDLGLEIALKGIVKGFRYKTIPVVWSAREHGVSKMSVLKSFVSHLSRGLGIRFGYR